MTAPAALFTLSQFSLLRGASSPEALVQQAHALGYAALALTDENTLGGVVRAHVAARACGLSLLIGSHWRVRWPKLPGGGFTLVAWAADRTGYGQISAWISRLRQNETDHNSAQAGSVPGDPQALPIHACADDVPELPGCLLMAVPWAWALPLADDAAWDAGLRALGGWLRERGTDRAWLGVTAEGRLDDASWQARLMTAARKAGLPAVAAPEVRMHQATQQPLLDILTAIRLQRPLSACGLALSANAEAHLWPPARWGRRFAAELIRSTRDIARRCTFRLDELRYEYPSEVLPEGFSPTQYLRALVEAGARQRYPEGTPEPVQAQLAHELALIAELAYEPYFLTVYDIVRFARERGILCQGRGSAANSAVCYCLGITEVDPARHHMLFERFISRARAEPPDIDVDFEHHRREEVVQYLYAKYGRERAALAASLIRWQGRSALRDVGKALGFAPAVVDALARQCRHQMPQDLGPDAIAAAGLSSNDPAVQRWLTLAQALVGAPRHRSQHTGGFVLTREPLTHTVPVVPAAMPGRTVIEWDKDDIDALGLLKVDVLALGILSALQGALRLVSERRGQPFTLGDIPRDDPATYAMIQRADTVGVFQIESRAQMSMLPRLRPANFYDLVVQVAIVRPGPIQGGMVHPYLAARDRQRRGLPLQLPRQDLRPALERTLGVPIFQEQVMQIAMLAAGFSAEEADALRRSMGAWRRSGELERFEQRLLAGMAARGYDLAFAQAIVRQIRGFGTYGFPESHAASFALLAYASAWLKCHEPAAFLAALLNAQPMGFYAPAQLVQDARRHGVVVRPVDVQASDWDCTLESGCDAEPPAVRLGLRLVSGLGEAAARRVVAARRERSLASVDDLARRAALDRKALQALARAGALQGLAGHRRRQWWAVSGWHAPLALERTALVGTGAASSAAVDTADWHPTPAPLGEEVWQDYAATGLSLRAHPMELLRARLPAPRWLPAQRLHAQPHGRLVGACGLVITRQKPGSAQGVLFLTLEDESGTVQVVVWRGVQARFQQALLHGRLLAIRGQWQRQGEGEHAVCHLIAGHVQDLSSWLGELAVASRDFH
ncbi:MAG: error-prone DNA polymerase [Tepidimonas sp.]|uniref:error-prone DNA polymerase n=1 Tax=Tepidimonas sp. TaxID=2002775 RepID=UPI004054D4CF